MKKKIGVLGLGSIGSRHSKNFKELGCEVKGYDPAYNPPSQDRRDRVIDWADAIVVATPTSQHYPDLLDIVKTDKAIFIEKPIANTPNIGLLTDHLRSRPVMVGYNLRFHSCVKKVREWLATGAIGKPLWARFTCAQFNNKPAYLRDGVILNWSHEIDLALHLLGPARLVTAAVSHNTQEDMADLILQHENHHCQTVVHLDYLTKWERRGFVIVGEDGAIEADLVSRQVFLRDNKGSLPEIYYGRSTFDGDYLAEARAFLDRLDGKGVDGCTAIEAMKVVDICFKAKEYVHGT